jgi:hypothetical protein
MVAPGTRSAPLHAVLRPHPVTAWPEVRAISARVQRLPEGALAVRYTLTGALDRLRVPQSGTARMGKDLWRHTCFELFLAAEPPGYHELNFSPSGEWAAYGFQQYRQGDPLRDPNLAPRMEVRRSEESLELDALVALRGPMAPYAAPRLRLGVSAVVEGADGRLAYWALRHPAPAPDFHHPEAFALEIDEVRH